MNAYIWNSFKDVRHERCLILLFSQTEIKIIKNLSLEKLQGQVFLKSMLLYH